jgi:putative aldouronate transport system substrate-binding protein
VAAIRRHKPAMLALALIAAFMTGCSGFQEPHPGESAARDSWTTLTVELFDRNITPHGAPPITDNFMTQYIQSHFGDQERIHVEFVTVPRAEEVERLNVLMASNQAPDIVFTYDLPTVYNFTSQGGLTDLTPYLEEHGQDLINVLGEEVLSAGRFEGKQFAIPAKRVLTAHSTTLIREDWLQELGLPLPETTEQFYDALRAFKDKKPGKYGDDIVPYGQIDYYHTTPLQYSFWDWDEITEEDLYAAPGWLMPGNRAAFRFLNQLYHEGLIDPDFPLDRFAQQFKKDLVNGRVGAASPNTNEPVYMGYLAELQHNDPNAVLTPIDPFTNANGSKMKPVLEKTGMYIMVPRSSKNAEAAVKYLNWMAQPSNYLTLQNGIEGVTYEMKDGLPVTLQNDDAKRMLYNYYDYCIIINGKFVSPTDKQLNVRANAFDPKYEAFTVKSITYGMTDGVETPQIKTILQSDIKYAAVLKEKDDEIFVKVITARPEDFDAVYEREVAEYMKMGGQQVMEDKRQAYRDQLRG